MSSRVVISNVILTNKAISRLVSGEAWFGERDLVGRKPRLPGIVRVLDSRKKVAALGFLSPGSRYFVKVFSRSQVEADKPYWRQVLTKAYERRCDLFDITDAFRVVHADADGIPGVVIDKYNDIWSIEVTSSGVETIKNCLIEIIADEFAPAAIVEKNSNLMRKGQGLSLEDRLAFGTKTLACVRELDQKFELDVLHGQKTGAYLDYRAFRIKAREFAKGNSLDAFCYQGWFSCHIAGFTGHVIALDGSAQAIKAAHGNARLNGHDNISSIKVDVFDYLSSCSEKFDFIHLDPPPFAKGHAKGPAALTGYKKLLKLSFGLVKEGAVIMLSSCSHAISQGTLEKLITDEASKRHIPIKIIFRGIQDRDHPVKSALPESLYLKGIAAKINWS